MALSSQLVLEEVGALLLGPSLLTADPLGPLLDDDEERNLSEGLSSPLPFSSYADPSATSSPFPCLSPSLAPPSPLKADHLPLPWLSADELFNSHVGADSGKEDSFSGMDWMAEKIDLSDFDLDSLIGSCDSEEPPSSPEELLASLGSRMDLDLDPLPFSSAPAQEDLGLAPLAPLPLDVPLSEPEVPVPATLEIEIKSEPPSPVSSLSPAYTLELGSEVDVTELEKVTSLYAASEAIQTSSIVLALPPTHIVVVLASKEELSGEQSDSDSGIGSVSGSPGRHPSPPSSPRPVCSSRTKPYSKPDPDADVPAASCKVKTASGPSRTVEKKLKKMEQNKTAATRYRQKKRAEQEVLHSECTELEQKNRELAERADSISREIQYLKDLLEEVRSAKNRKTKSTSA
ncbi:cyclic AMP-dependent transcription factor ATF-4 [Denticeps clupeoides]|uniref:cyclic AMP-dependent transcription factor ATF-4 n=1 Tax=Denticeps clupeoides TaxID=299321 RepID=UPI0010A46025|nr:cyclic AMP-dependent transcription factor ATF-4 [Denticeps clupeoides]